MRFIFLICLLISGLVVAKEEKPKLKITPLADNIYQHISYKYVESFGMVAASGLVVVDGNDAHIIDTPWTISETQELVEWITAQGFTVKSAVATHFHEDASGGISFFNHTPVKTYATALTNHLLTLDKRPKSSDEISSDKFAIANHAIEIFYPGAGHTQDNIVVWLPNAKVLFGGCFVKSLHSKGLGNIADASLAEWPKSIQRVINEYPQAEVVVPGHGQIGDISLLRHTAQLALSANND